MIKTIWQYKGYVWQNAIQDIRHRYAGSTMGFLWNVIHPLFQIILFTIVFSKIMPIKSPNLPKTLGFAIYLCSGLLPWLSFCETVSRCSIALVVNANYLNKISVPVHIFITQNAVSSFLSLIISSTIMVFFFALAGHLPTWSWLWLPFVLICFQLFALGIGLILGALTPFFRDTGEIVTMGLQLWFWATPIVYTEEVVPQVLRKWIPLNPVYHYIQVLHHILVYKRDHILFSEIIVMVLIAVVALIIGGLTIRALQFEIRDVL